MKHLFWFQSDVGLETPAYLLREENRVLKEIISFQDQQALFLRAEIAELRKQLDPACKVTQLEAKEGKKTEQWRN